MVAVAHRERNRCGDRKIRRRIDLDLCRPAGQNHPRRFKSAGVTEAVMAGGIRKVKLFGNFRPDLRGARFLGQDEKPRRRCAAARYRRRTRAATGSRFWNRLCACRNIITTAGVLTRQRRPMPRNGRISAGHSFGEGNRPSGNRPNGCRKESGDRRGGSGGRHRCGDSAGRRWRSPAVWSSRSASRNRICASTFRPSASKRSKRLRQVGGACLAVEAGKTIIDWKRMNCCARRTPAASLSSASPLE